MMRVHPSDATRHCLFPLEHAFRARDLVGAAGIDFDGHAEGAGEGFEGGFNDVVGVDPGALGDVEGELAMVDDRHEKLAHQLRIVSADALGGNLQAITEVGPSGKVEHYFDEGFVKGGDEMAEAVNPFAIAQGLGQGHAEGNPHIFVGVVVVNFPIAVGVDVEVYQAVGGDLMEHVVKERNSGFGATLTCAIKGNADLHIRFAGFAVNAGGAVQAGDGGGAIAKLHRV